MKKILIYIVVIIMCIIASGCNNPEQNLKDDEDTNNYTDVLEMAENYQQTLANISATDDFGRSFSAYESLDDTKYVGMYYALWLGEHPSEQTDTYNVNELLKTEDGTKKLWAIERSEDYDPVAAPINKYYFWGEPLYGYYSSRDPWVMAKHIEAITLAKIDFLYLDVSNGFSYIEPVKVLLDILSRFRSEGWKTPQLMFMCNSGSMTVVNQVYSSLYSNEEYNDHWFAPNGKPMISVMMNHPPEDVREQVENAYPDTFDVMGSVWPNYPLTDEQKENGFPWIDWNKFHTNYGGTMNVSVAQHVSLPFSKSVHTPSEYNSNWGRGYNFKKNRNEADKVNENFNFEQQWADINKINPKMVTVTGWNEWIALKLSGVEKGDFVDNCNVEFSRDLEMSKDGYKDNGIIQLAKNVRERKGSGTAAGYSRTKLYVNQGIAQWKKGGATYKDFAGDVFERNSRGYLAKDTYTDTSNRNDIEEVRIAHDLTNVHFLIRTRNDIIKDNTSGKFLNILFGIKDNTAPNFYGYQYRINSKIVSDSVTTVERSKGGYDFETVGTVNYKMGTNFMQISVPREMLGLADVNTEHIVNFKVTDNVLNPQDIMDYYVSGDSAPMGRMSYQYKMLV